MQNENNSAATNDHKVACIRLTMKPATTKRRTLPFLHSFFPPVKGVYVFRISNVLISAFPLLWTEYSYCETPLSEVMILGDGAFGLDDLLIARHMVD